MKKIIGLLVALSVALVAIMSGCSFEPSYYATGVFKGFENPATAIFDFGDTTTTADDKTTILGLYLTSDSHVVLPKIGETVKVGIRNNRIYSIEKEGE